MSAPWLGRYLDAEPLGRDGSFRRHAARSERDGRRCLVISASPAAEPARAREALGLLARAHDAVRHPAIPRPVRIEGELVGVQEGLAFVELGSEATIDGMTLLERLIDARALLGFGEAESLVGVVAVGLRAAATAPGGPFRIGRLSLSSLLVGEDGCLQLLGLGHPVACTDERGRVTSAHAVFQAPEVAAGKVASEGADVVALLGLRRALLPHVELPPPLGRVLRGERSAPEEASLERAVASLDARLAAADDAGRGDLASIVEALATLRALVGIEADPDGLARLLSDVARGLPIASDWDLSPPTDATEECLVLSAAGAWIEGAAGERGRVELGPSLRRMLALLLERHRREPERTTSTWELLEAGWPGEKLVADAGANRVYAAVKRLRNMGLRGVIQRHDDGYRIAPHARLTEIEAD